MGIKHTFTSSKSDGADATKVKPSDWNDDHEIDGDVDFGGHAVTNLEDEAYNQTAWNGSLEAPTKNAIRDKIEALVLTGGGVTDFLALDDTPDAYSGFTAPGALLGVNTASTAVEFRYSTSQYIDIRDYGTVAHLGNITAALQAAIDAYSTHRQKRIRVPWVGTSPRYILDAISWPSGGWTLELDCGELALNAALDIPGNSTLRGIRNLFGVGSFTHGPGVLPNIFDNTGGLDQCVKVRVDNVLIEHVGITGGLAALDIQGKANIIVRDCVLETQRAGTPLKLDSNFWIILEDIVCIAKNDGTQYAIEFTTDVNWGPNQSLTTGRNIKVFNSGILFRSVYGPEGVASTYLEDLCSENQVSGTDLVNIDSTTNGVGAIKLVNPVIADPLGTSYVLNNTGLLTSGITIEGAYNAGNLINPTSTPIQGFYQNQSIPGTLFSMQSVPAVQVGSKFLSSWQLHTPTSIDAKLLTAPVGLPWVFGTPIAVLQDPATWFSWAGGVITPGRLAPDGSTMAGRVVGGGGCTVSGATVALAVGDWVICGVWARSPTGGTVGSNTGPSFVTGDATFRVNGHAFAESLGYSFLESNIPADGWQWLCQAYQITATAGGSVEIRFYLNNNGSDFDFFNPCGVLIPASAGIDDAWAIKLARSLRGGWSTNGKAGNVCILDHQALDCGAGLNLRDGVTAPSTRSGWAQIYVDTADGDLKVKFGDGTVKTIVVDT